MTTELGKAMKEARDYLGLSLRQAAKLTGYSPTYFSLIERGEVKSIGYGAAEKMGRVLLIDPDIILVLAGHIPKDALEIIRSNPRQALSAIRALGSMTATGQRGVMNTHNGEADERV